MVCIFFKHVMIIVITGIYNSFGRTQMNNFCENLFVVTDHISKNISEECVHLFSYVGTNTDIFTQSQLVHCQKAFMNSRRPTIISSATTVMYTDTPETKCRKPLFIFIIITSDALESRIILTKIMKRNWYNKVTSLLGLLPCNDHMYQFFTNSDNVGFKCNALVLTTSTGIEDRYLCHSEDDLQYQALNYASIAALSGFSDSIQNKTENTLHLNGTTLRAITRNDPSVISIQKSHNKTESSGFVGELWKLLEEMLGFRTEYITDGDTSPGMILRNGTCTGMTGMVQRGQADIALSLMKVTASRLRCGDWLTPWMTVRLRILMNEPEEGNASRDHYFSAFSPNLWLSVVTSILLLGCGLAITLSSPIITKDEPRIVTGFNVLTEAILTTAAAILYQQGYYRAARPYSARIAIVFCYITGIILMASYSGRATSHSAVKKTKLPFTSLHQMNEHSTYELSVLGNSSSHQQFRTSTSGLLKKVYERQMDHDWRKYPKTKENAIRNICSKEKYAYLGPYELLAPLITRANCNIVALPETFSEVTFGLLVKKSSPHNKPINQAYLRVWESGFRACLMERFLPQEKVQPSIQANQAISLGDVQPILLICTFGSFLAVFVLAIEFIASLVMNPRTQI